MPAAPLHARSRLRAGVTNYVAPRAALIIAVALFLTCERAHGLVGKDLVAVVVGCRRLQVSVVEWSTANNASATTDASRHAAVGGAGAAQLLLRAERDGDRVVPEQREGWRHRPCQPLISRVCSFSMHDVITNSAYQHTFGESRWVQH